ncbi:hypothetical protein FOL47_005625 [Perkinsus chesapeaki]|uniref:Uncharacterized protein n=1 Tax=Perkinsus chesapeaki TaxID=330153 RepID=A0A7J6MZ53_PERCH|nr:hypothetical protein FOL47_005625 [Perkinsus chesapeaki]
MRFLFALSLLAIVTGATRSEQAPRKEEISMKEAAKYVKGSRGHRTGENSTADFQKLLGESQAAWQTHPGTGMKTIPLSSVASNSAKVKEWLKNRDGRGSQEL